MEHLERVYTYKHSFLCKMMNLSFIILTHKINKIICYMIVKSSRHVITNNNDNEELQQ